MNPTTITETTLLFAGEIFDGRDSQHPLMKLVDGTTVALRVRILPARHLTTPEVGYLDLRAFGRESEELQLCVQRNVDGKWVPLDANSVDNLDRASHVALLDVSYALNFGPAVSQAERKIATGTALLALTTRQTEILLEPTKRVLASWTSSLTTQISAVLGAKKS